MLQKIYFYYIFKVQMRDFLINNSENKKNIEIIKI